MRALVTSTTSLSRTHAHTHARSPRSSAAMLLGLVPAVEAIFDQIRWDLDGACEKCGVVRISRALRLVCSQITTLSRRTDLSGEVAWRPFTADPFPSHLLPSTCVFSLAITTTREATHTCAVCFF
jgi:hypothetical protein